jgi:hypothetical protein
MWVANVLIGTYMMPLAGHEICSGIPQDVLTLIAETALVVKISGERWWRAWERLAPRHETSALGDF